MSKFEMLRNLQKTGYIVEMDDFGSGYSSLNMLRDMPIDIIKIDMMFIKDMISDKSMQNGQSMSRTSIILHNLINMMNELGLEPITEGVETEEQYHILTQMGSRMFQGYLFAKPIPVEDFEKQFLHEAANPEKTV